MKMFIDTSAMFTFNNHSLADPISSNQSISSSFSSNSSLDEYVTTPISTPPHRRISPDEQMKLEESYFGIPTPSVTPDSFEASAGFGIMSSMDQNIMSGFQNQPMIFTGNGSLYGGPNLMESNTFPNIISPMNNMLIENDGLPSNCSGLSSFYLMPGFDSNSSEDFVNPSQTTFMDIQSPMRPSTMSIELQYDMDSPDSDCQSYSSLDTTPSGGTVYGSVRSARSVFEDPASPTTPSRMSSIRQPRFRPLPSSLALHKIQSESQENPSSEASRLHLTRRRMKQELKGCFLPDNISRLKPASKECLHPGCKKRFQRQEHLKRHEKVHKKPDPLPCNFCHKTFSRSDNLKSHIKLHFNNKNSKRTQHVGQAALDVYLSMGSKPRRNSDQAREVKVEKQSPKSRASRL